MPQSPDAIPEPQPDRPSAATAPTRKSTLVGNLGILREAVPVPSSEQPGTQIEMGGELGMDLPLPTPASPEHAMFNSTRSVIINGGTFTTVQGVMMSGTPSLLASAGSGPSTITSLGSDSQSPPATLSPAAPWGEDILRSERISQIRKDSQIYHDSLFEKGRGSPLWTPGPNLNLPREYRRTGTRIGDVGIIKGSGAFSFLFNILHPADHPINRGKVPFTFVPLLLDLSDDIEKLYVTDKYIASKSVTKSSAFEDNGLAFQSTAAEGAILTTPGGAYSTDLENRTIFEDYAKDHSISWYEYANGSRGRQARNGDIRLVYGTDKVTSWGMATFSSREEQEVRLEFRKMQSTGSYTWNCHGAGASRVGPGLVEHEDLVDAVSESQAIINQSVFIRTINMKLSENVWKEKIAHTIPINDQEVVAGEGHGEGTLLSSEPSDATQLSGRQSDGKQGKSFASNEVKIYGAISHPCDVLNHLMLSLMPDAQVAISDDADWITIFEEIISQTGPREPTPSTHRYVDNDPLLQYLSQRLLFRNGGVFLGSDRRKKRLAGDRMSIKFTACDTITPTVFEPGYPPIRVNSELHNWHFTDYHGTSESTSILPPLSLSTQDNQLQYPPFPSPTAESDFLPGDYNKAPDFLSRGEIWTSIPYSFRPPYTTPETVSASGSTSYGGSALNPVDDWAEFVESASGPFHKDATYERPKARKREKKTLTADRSRAKRQKRLEDEI